MTKMNWEKKAKVYDKWYDKPEKALENTSLGIPKKHKKFTDDSIYKTPEWRKVRNWFISTFGMKCMCCGKEFNKLSMTDIVSVYARPDLCLSLTNLQLLCTTCKENKEDGVDYKSKQQKQLIADHLSGKVKLIFK